ncbi:NUDIX domain-containing protein [Haloarcula sp. S1CR25-12]|uniref:NUDIX domain-containing protein n=1 Tax=Haloarcula saliterrae TaxID=2950534 RepID=A0ABU2F7K8_9EURY|nr:NUDIX domain-containing protein [Haloarcula sp. S1CR25-12]MDS0258224.1 NUDIX domain-containing protein [Haloarcula sp. S1CR25-12]
MTTVDDLWYLADVASQQAEQTYHDLVEEYDGFVEFTRHRRVQRPRFRTVAEDARDHGAPFGAHSLAFRPTGELLLVRHDGVDMWVLPGGELDPGETFSDAALRELREESGIEATIDGLGMLGRIEFYCDNNNTWGVLPVFEARAETTDIAVQDPDNEISEARWFDELPADTRDREEIQRWRERS